MRQRFIAAYRRRSQSGHVDGSTDRFNPDSAILFFAKEAYAMFLTLSALAFTFALAIFVYCFDNFMGASDTADIAAIMAGMHDRTSWLNKQLTKKRRGAAAGS